MSEVLEELRPRCSLLQELSPLCEQLHSRLSCICDQVDRLFPARVGGGAHEAERERLLGLVMRFAALLHELEGKSLVHRLADDRRLMQFRALHTDMDALVRMLRIDVLDGMNSDWQDEWDSNCERVELRLMELVTDSDSLYTELRSDRKAQQAALAIIKYALQQSSNGQQVSVTVTTGSDHVDVLRAALRRILSFAQVGIPDLPAWFLSPVQLKSDREPFSGSQSAELYHGVWQSSPQTAVDVVVKRWRKASQGETSDGHDEGSVAVQRDMALWYPVQHANLLKMYGGCHLSGLPFVVMERPSISGHSLVSLEEHLSASIDHRRMAFRLLAQVASALLCLHDHKILHNDLRCAQIYISDDGQAKLGHMNFMDQAVSDQKQSSQQPEDDPGSDNQKLDQQEPAKSQSTAAASVPINTHALRWRAPEILAGKLPTTASDIYSLGMCALEAITGDLPYGLLDDHNVRRRVLKGELPDRPTNLDDSVWTLIEAMCDVNPLSRPDMTTVVEEITALAEEEARRDLASGRPSIALAARRNSNASTTSSRNSYADPRHSEYFSSALRTSRSSSFSSEVGSRLSVSALTKEEPDSTISTSVVTLQQKWLGIKINSIGTKVVVSKFQRSGGGAMGEIEASQKVRPGDLIAAINEQSTRGMNRHEIGALIQGLPRPLRISFQRDPQLLADSFYFEGLRRDVRWRDRNPGVTLPGSAERLLGSMTRSFTFEFWFSLSEGSDVFTGGILLGAQDIAFEANAWPYVHRPLVLVDANGRLCSLLMNKDSPVVVAESLVPNQWYQLIVSYNDQERQMMMYVDGVLRSASTGSLHRDWVRFQYLTVGSGCISGLNTAKPSADFAGWYGFNGLVHDFKVWHGVLSELAVLQLFRGASDCVDAPSYSLQRDISRRSPTQQQAILVQRVRASCPRHVVAQVYS